ncbi:MAG: DUF928 domain-containing protein, partial [Cyanobacteria bacterium J06632_22]
VGLGAALQAELEAASTPVERAAIAADNGLWHDAASFLTEDMATEMANPLSVQAWQDLLEAVDLADLADEPFL